MSCVSILCMVFTIIFAANSLYKTYELSDTIRKLGFDKNSPYFADHRIEIMEMNVLTLIFLILSLITA